MASEMVDLYMSGGWLWRSPELYRWVERYSSAHSLPFEVVPGTERSQVLVLRFPDRPTCQQFIEDARAVFPWVDFL